MKQKAPTLADTNNLNDLKNALKFYSNASLSENSKKSYSADWVDFKYWCKRVNRKALPATSETVALYLTKMSAHLKVSSLRRRVTAIRKAHEYHNYNSPTQSDDVKKVLRGIIRTKGEYQTHALPTLLNHINAIINNLPISKKGIRDKALLLLGFAGGFRRSELVSLDFEDIKFADEGIVIVLRKSKTDQTGRTRKIAITYGLNPITCPILALKEWLKVSKINKGALFRPIDKWDYISQNRLTDQSVRLILKESLKRAGIREKGFSGHSLRAGFVTVATINGASESEIQRTTGHQSIEVLRRYVRDAEIFKRNASRKLGL